MVIEADGGTGCAIGGTVDIFLQCSGGRDILLNKNYITIIIGSLPCVSMHVTMYDDDQITPELFQFRMCITSEVPGKGVIVMNHHIQLNLL